MPSTATSKYTADAGGVYGRLTLVEKLDPTNNGQTRWRCLCECGQEKVTVARSILKGLTTSCGCRQREAAGNANRRHGGAETPEFKAWQALISRCTNRRSKSWKNYGGRGIAVSEVWMADFRTFLADMGPRPGPRYSVERLDNNAGYSKENCKWATHTEQTNNRRNNRRITVGDVSLTAPQWSRITGVGGSAIRGRIRAGWPPEAAVNHVAGPRAYGGVSLGALAEYSGVHYSVIHARIHKLGWSLERTLTTPTAPNGSRTNLRKTEAKA